MTTLKITAQKSLSMPNVLLRVEGFAIFAAAIVLYAHLGGSALMFGLLLFTPDVFMLGYLRNIAWGAIGYNFGHMLAVPITLGLIALSLQSPIGVQLSLIWLAHIGMDRVVGYGLKYATSFKDTHLQRV